MINGPTKHSHALTENVTRKHKRIIKIIILKIFKTEKLTLDLDFVERKDERLPRILGWRPRSSAGLAELFMADSVDHS